MVAAWSVALFLAGLALVAVELAYPRRYVGVMGLTVSVVGLVAMVTPSGWTQQRLVFALLAAALATLVVAVPFYRRYAPHVGPMHAPLLRAGDFGVVEKSIPAGGQGLVRAGGILWTAHAQTQADVGAKVRVLVIEPDRLWVEPESDATPEGDDHEHDQGNDHGKES